MLIVCCVSDAVEASTTTFYDPSPDRGRKTRWSKFLKSHWESLAAIDFFTVEIYTLAELTQYMVLVCIDYATQKVEVVGISQQPYGDWMNQMARNLTDSFSGFLKDKKYLIHQGFTSWFFVPMMLLEKLEAWIY